ncbi:MAG: tRNA (adenosine(37)-N6)-threonylcarbamoyltransferase complex transferase subunit TsaD [Patescibacteria group bacterium]
MIILAIETSCDETAISIVEASGEFSTPKFKVLAHCVSSQVKLHAEWGGVVPNLAKREHARNIIPLVQEALAQASLLEKIEKSEQKISLELQQKLAQILAREPEVLQHILDFTAQYRAPKFDVIAFTRGPGLEPALWVGVNTAQALSCVWEAPSVPVDHMEGHLLSPLLNYSTPPDFPILALLISGGHTELILSKSWLEYEKLGETRDDAVGEAFDKVARILGLPYPGGPEIGNLASQAEQENLPKLEQKLPRPMINSGDLDFSFSGLKTAVLYLVQKNPEINKAEVAREFQQAVIDVLLAKTILAIKKHAPKSVIIAGGVANNQELIKQFRAKTSETFPDINLLVPEAKLTTDNATMIAVAGYFHALKNEFVKDGEEITADGNLQL